MRKRGRTDLEMSYNFLGAQVSKIKISCKEAGSIQDKAHRARAPPHAPKQIKVRSWSCASNSYINREAKNWRMVRNKHRSHKWHWIARKNDHISKVVELIFKVELNCLPVFLQSRQVGRTFKLVNPKHKGRASVRNDSFSLNLLVC